MISPLNRLARAVGFLVGMLAMTAWGQQTCVEVLQKEVLACFKQHGIPLDLGPGKQDAALLLQETQSMDPALCLKKDAYKAAARCAIDHLGRCLVLVKMDGSLPDIELFVQGVDFMCNHKIDTACTKKQEVPLQSCTTAAIQKLVTNSGSQDHNNEHIACTMADIVYDCTRKHIHTCGADTLRVMLDLQNNYFVPRVCTDRRPSRPRSQTGLARDSTASLQPCYHALLFLVAATSLTLLL